MMWQRALANPWSVVAGSTLALVVCNGPVVAFTFGLFLKPISQEFGWNRGAMSAASAVAALMIAVVVPFAGMLVDRFGVRRILLPVIVLSSISIAAISLTPASLLDLSRFTPSLASRRQDTDRSPTPRPSQRGSTVGAVWRSASPWQASDLGSFWCHN
jgi:MFS family permease